MISEYITGVDIGGTKIALTLATSEGKILKKEKFPTGRDPAKTIEKINLTMEKILTDIPYDKVRATGISCGGPLDSDKGLILSPPNLPGWDEVPICSILKKRTGIPCFLANDANACALAEWLWGAGRGTRNMIFLTFGTGLGAGLILNGSLYEGSSGLAGEAGHIRMAENGPSGYGKNGSWEGFCSGGGLSRYYRQIHGGEEKSAKEICSLASGGDEKALQIIHESARYLGRGIALLLDILNPEVVVIGSIFAREEALYRKLMEEEIAREALPLTAGDCRILPAELGESLGDMAALGVAINALRRSD